jgi:hypothetical protein
MDEVLTVLEYNGETGETTERPFTAEEIAQHKIMQIESKARKAEREARIAARESALAKLAALGLTEEEVAAL